VLMHQLDLLMTITLSAWQMAGWKTNSNNSSTMESKLWRNAGPSAFYFSSDYVEK